MYKVIGRDNREYGPADAEQIRRWIAERRVTAESRAQEVGHEEWKTLGEFEEFADAVRAAAVAPPIPQAQAATSADLIAGEILARQPQVDIGSCISRGFDLVMNNFGLAVGATVVVFLILSTGIGALLAGPLMGGLFFMFLKRIRGEQATVGDVFAGFGPQFGALFIGQIVAFILVALGLCLCILPGIYLAVCWTFMLPLIMERKLDFWAGMEVSRKVVHKHWWSVFGLVLLAKIITLVGVVACGIGIIVTAPIGFAAVMYAYEDMFGTRTEPRLPATPGTNGATA